MVDVAVVGGGVIGLSLAWRAAQRGVRVTVVDPSPGAGATGTAAGMLAPVTELHYAETPLLALNVASARLYPAFVAELESVTGRDVGYRSDGTVVAAWDSADLGALRDLHSFQLRLGLRSDMLTGRDLRGLEPHAAPGLPGGLFAADDHSIDPRALHGALHAAATVEGVTMVARRARAVHLVDDRAAGVVLDDGDRVLADVVVLAAGAWSPTLAGLPSAAVPVRPVKGQTLLLRGEQSGLLRHVLRGSIRGASVYLVPRAPGRLVVGASSEEAGYDERPRAGAVYELLRDAEALFPVILEMELEEVSTSLRPGTPDNAPLLGRSPMEGLLLATGHYRNGVLLAPVTADAISGLIVDGVAPPDIASFGACRFAPTPAPATS